MPSVLGAVRVVLINGLRSFIVIHAKAYKLANIAQFEIIVVRYIVARRIDAGVIDVNYLPLITGGNSCYRIGSTSKRY